MEEEETVTSSSRRPRVHLFCSSLSLWWPARPEHGECVLISQME